MKLVDQLVQELPRFGGWPKTENDVQRISGRFKARWAIPKCAGITDYMAFSLVCTDVVSKNQYEAALAASKQVKWDGEGLPPVGLACEWLASGDHDWMEVKVLAYHEDEVWLQPLNGAQSFTVGNPDDFRPIRTEAERKREDRISTLNGFIDGFMKSTKGDHSNLGEALYEWLTVLDRLK